MHFRRLIRAKDIPPSIFFLLLCTPTLPFPYPFTMLAAYCSGMCYPFQHIKFQQAPQQRLGTLLPQLNPSIGFESEGQSFNCWTVSFVLEGFGTALLFVLEDSCDLYNIYFLSKPAVVVIIMPCKKVLHYHTLAAISIFIFFHGTVAIVIS